MEAVEFMKQKNRMCDYYSGRTCTHDDSGETCPAMCIDCEITTDDLEQLVAIVEKWAKEHPGKPEQEQQKPEHPEEAADVTKTKQDEPCVKTIQDNLEGAIYREIGSNKTRIENLEHDVFVMRNNLAILGDKIYALREKVDHTPTKEESQTPEPKRTNKDVLLAEFPDALMDNNGIPYACPNRLDAHYNCDKFENCFRCRHTHWLAEVEE